VAAEPVAESAPRWRASITDSWHLGTRQEIAALAETERRVSAENVELHRQVNELLRRHDLARAECLWRIADPVPRRIFHILNGDI
jgi:hypothetical protein